MNDGEGEMTAANGGKETSGGGSCKESSDGDGETTVVSGGKETNGGDGETTEDTGGGKKTGNGDEEATTGNFRIITINCLEITCIAIPYTAKLSRGKTFAVFAVLRLTANVL